MKITFPYFVTSFQCDCTKQEVISRIEKAVESQHNNLNILKKDIVANEKIILQADTGSYMFVNSFMPIITVDISSSENKSLVFMSFKLKKSTRAMLIFFTVFALLFEALLLYFAVTNQLSTSALLLLPIGFLIFSLLISILGLRFSSKNILEILSEALNGENAKNYVSAQILKMFLFYQNEKDCVISKNKGKNVQNVGESKLILKYLGFLKNTYGLNFKFQTFSEYMDFMGPIYTYSFYNDYGCFTLHNVAQKGEWGWFVSRKFSSDQYELLSREIIQTDYIQKNCWFLSSALKNLELIIKSQIEKTSSFFGIRVEKN